MPEQPQQQCVRVCATAHSNAHDVFDGARAQPHQRSRKFSMPLLQTPHPKRAKGYMLQTVKQSSRPHSLYRASAYTPYVHPELQRLSPKTLIPHTARPQTPNYSNPKVVIYPIYPINRPSRIACSNVLFQIFGPVQKISELRPGVLLVGGLR